MKRKAYIVPAVEVHTISVQHMICNSIKGVGGDTEIIVGEEDDPVPPGSADSRRRGDWDDEDDEW